MDVRPFYHDGMRDLQDRFDGRRVADALEKNRVRHDFWDADRELIESTPFFFIATSFGTFTDCSLKSGVPGFLKIVGPGTVEYPEYDGNSMYRTLGNIARNPNVGLLFVKFDGQTLRVRRRRIVSRASGFQPGPDSSKASWTEATRPAPILP